MREAVLVSSDACIGHGVGCKGHVESRLIRLMRGSFYASSRRHAGDDDLRYSLRLQLGFKIRARKCAPSPLRYYDVPGLAI